MIAVEEDEILVASVSLVQLLEAFAAYASPLSYSCLRSSSKRVKTVVCFLSFRAKQPRTRSEWVFILYYTILFYNILCYTMLYYTILVEARASCSCSEWLGLAGRLAGRLPRVSPQPKQIQITMYLILLLAKLRDEQFPDRTTGWLTARLMKRSSSPCAKSAGMKHLPRAVRPYITNRLYSK